MKYVKKFNTILEEESYIPNSNYISYTIESDKVNFYKDPTLEYLTFIANRSSKLTFAGSNSGNLIQYSLDNGNTWSTPSSNVDIILNENEEVLLKGEMNPISNYGIGNFSSQYGDFNLRGNIMSLLYGDNFINQKDLTNKNFAFYYLFSTQNQLNPHGCNIINAKDLILPATTLSYSCYESMFLYCFNLITAPALPATTLVPNCYKNMFQQCALTKAPMLPATSIASNCYSYMFYNCTNLTIAPELPATALANNCYDSMFAICTSLVNAPALPATALANNCYTKMFYSCTSLITAPALPATTVFQESYKNMFQDCTNLINAPSLPATTLASYCYSNMFYNCTSLTTAPALPATTLANNCYFFMFGSCTSLTTAPALSAMTLAENCYSNMFYYCISLQNAPALPATTLAPYCYKGMFWYCTNLTTSPDLLATSALEHCYDSMFENCSRLNYIKMMATEVPSDGFAYWVYGVSSSGTFVKNSLENILSTGDNGIPNGWTIQNI